MKRKLCILFCILFLVNNTVVFAKQEAPNRMAESNKKTDPPFLERLMKHSLDHSDINNIKVENNSGLQHVFSINDGFQERVLRKVVYWLNNSTLVNGESEVFIANPSNKVMIKMANDEVITFQPAYTCVDDNKRKICTAKEGELIVSENRKKVILKSQKLYDWLMVGWRKEPDGLTKEELLEEALFSRYLDYLGPAFSEFFMCPKIQIEPIDGDPRRHIIYASALDYSGHHGGDYSKLTFYVSDSNQTGLQVTNIKIMKHISEEESRKQCQTYD
ncbi:hypothetical protein [Psychrobacillus sp. NPDC093180]|uniref:hypothetical protein n=1 Tax=Psychrobacillus sp. NPDC093180 TaxID=3364489 RepID=UPI00382F6652